MTDESKPPFPDQFQPVPGTTSATEPRPDQGAGSHRGTVAVTGGKPIA